MRLVRLSRCLLGGFLNFWRAFLLRALRLDDLSGSFAATEDHSAICKCGPRLDRANVLVRAERHSLHLPDRDTARGELIESRNAF
jgi:hypothetical protein